MEELYEAKETKGDEAIQNQTNQDETDSIDSTNQADTGIDYVAGSEADSEGLAADETEADVAKIKPEGEPVYEIDVLVKAKDLFDYSLRHTYTSFWGLFSTVLGVLMVYLFFARNASVLYLLFGIIVIFYIPLNLWLVAKQQSMQEVFKHPLHYAFYENCVEISQGDLREVQEWKNMLKAVSTSSNIIMYTGRNRASIFPRRDLQPDATALIQVISTHMDPKRVKIKQ